MAALVNLLFTIYAYGLIAYAVLSWIQHPQALLVRRWLDRFYAPLLDPLRKAMGSMQTGGAQIDFSPMILLVVVVLVQRVVVSALLRFSM